MSISMHSASVPVFVRNLNNVLAWLDKAQAHAEAKKFDTANYLTMRLAPDMLPFIKQIQIASDGAKGCVARLAGVEIPKWDDTEVTLDDLRARIRKTIDYVQSVPAAQIDGSEACHPGCSRPRSGQASRGAVWPPPPHCLPCGRP
jgi:hypothetical protein